MPAKFNKGDMTPSWSAVDHTGKTIRSQDLRQYNAVVLWFFAEAGGPACTAQGCYFRDMYAELRGRNVAVFGVSFDPVEKGNQNRAFAQQHNFPYTLLCDETRQLGLMFGACDDKAAKHARRVGVLMHGTGRIHAYFPEVDPTSFPVTVMHELPLDEDEAKPPVATDKPNDGTVAGPASTWNVNSWHWEEKNMLPWTKTRLTELLVGLQGEKVEPATDGDELVSLLDVSITKIAVEGEAYVNIRKGKKRPGYEFSVTCDWSGSAAKGAETVKVEGTLRLPYVCDDVDDAAEGKFDVKVQSNKSGPAIDKACEAMSKATPRVRTAMATWVAEITAQ